MSLLLAAVGLLLAGGFIALSSSSERANRIGPWFAVAGCAAGFAFAIVHLFRGPELTLTLARELLFGGRIMIGIDPLSAFFLAPVFGLGGLGAIYGAPYLAHYKATKRLGAPWFSYNLLVAAMSLVLVARDSLAFLFGWEVMSLAAYSLVSFDHEVDSSRRAGWIYLLASHVAMILLVAMFLILGKHAGSLEFGAFAGAAQRTPPTVILALALAGFGIKAGLIPVHVWLPEAHAAAPSHVSALMSGVLIKMGIYGLLRIIVIMGPTRAFPSSLLIVLGLTGAVLGIVLALYQRDMKRAMAYSSVENIGIIVLGIGVGLHGLEHGRLEMAALGFFGGLLHIWNHAIAKGLLFFSAGSILCATGTKDIEELGGVMKQMPKTGLLMIIGAVAICALPPLGAFAGEWLIYLGLLQNVRGSISMSIAVGIMGLVGCLTCLCFVRIVGIVLLGTARRHREAHEAPLAMVAPMGALAASSLLIALAPSLAVAPLESVVAEIAHRPLPIGGVPLRELGWMSGALLFVAAGIAAITASIIRKRGLTSDSTWGCGYAAPTERMQYTGRGFSELTTERLLPKMLRPAIDRPSALSLFAGKTTFRSETSDPLTRGIYEPFIDRWASRLSRLRWMQQGALHLYLVYILVILMALLGWMSLRSWTFR